MAKSNEELAKRVEELLSDGMKRKQIIELVKKEGFKASDRTIDRYIKKISDPNAKEKSDKSEKSEKSDVNEEETKFHSVLEEEGNVTTPFFPIEESRALKEEEIKQLVLQSTKSAFEKLDTVINPIIDKIDKRLEKKKLEKSEPTKLDMILNETKEELKRGTNHKAIKSVFEKISHDTLFNTDISEVEKKAKRELIMQTSNYVELFQNNEIILSICGTDLPGFKAGLYQYDIKTLTFIKEEINMRLSTGYKDFENFIKAIEFTTSAIELFSDILLGCEIAGISEEFLADIDADTLKMVAAELSVSKYLSPRNRIIMCILGIVLKKIVNSEGFKKSANGTMRERLGALLLLFK